MAVMILQFTHTRIPLRPHPTPMCVLTHTRTHARILCSYTIVYLLYMNYRNWEMYLSQFNSFCFQLFVLTLWGNYMLNRKYHQRWHYVFEYLKTQPHTFPLWPTHFWKTQKPWRLSYVSLSGTVWLRDYFYYEEFFFCRI